MTRRKTGGGVILQTDSQPEWIFFSKSLQIVFRRSQIFLYDSAKELRSLTIICDLQQFRQNSMKITAKDDRRRGRRRRRRRVNNGHKEKVDGAERKFSKILQNHEKIAKINGAKDCKFEFGAVQRNANLVDLENPCKMRLFSLS